MPNKTFNIPQITLKQLLRMTPSNTKRKSKPGAKRKRPDKTIYQRQSECRVVSAQYGAGSRVGFKRSRPKHSTWYNEMRASVQCPTSKKRRYSYVRFYGPPALDTPVWVWCSCEHFAYHYAWVLQQLNASDISSGYDNRGIAIRNEPPDIVNEHKRPGLCKHLLATAAIALRQTKDFAGEKAESTTMPSKRQSNVLSRHEQITQW